MARWRETVSLAAMIFWWASACSEADSPKPVASDDATSDDDAAPSPDERDAAAPDAESPRDGAGADSAGGDGASGSDTNDADVAEQARCTDAAGRCDDGDPCTTDECESGACRSVPIPGCCREDADCNDGVDCTQDSCAPFVGRCLNLPADNTCCVSAADCEDSNACTADLCAANRCVYPTLPLAGCGCAEASECNDWNDCTVDRCEGGLCGYSAAPESGCCDSAQDCGDGPANRVLCHQAICYIPPAIPCTDDGACKSPSACDLGACERGVCAYGKLPGCCELSSECNDNVPATQDACVANECIHLTGSTQACEMDSDCTAPSPCMVGTCATKAGLCSWTLVPGPGCCASDAECPPPATACSARSCEALQCAEKLADDWVEVHASRWDQGGIEGWTIIADGSGATWHVSNKLAISLPSSLRFAAPALDNFDVGVARGVARSPEWQMPLSGPARLRFWVAPFVESMLSVDQLDVRLLSSSGQTAIWTKGQGGGSILGWREVEVDLGSLLAPGEVFQMEIEFDSVDATQNDKLGAFLDDVTVEIPCGAPP